MPAKETKGERPPPWEQETERESAGFGLWLRRQREVREVPLREISDVTKISMRYLEALEQDRFDVLPAPVFAKGFLRQYSRYVGLDVDEVVNSFLIATGEIEARSPEEEEEKEERERNRSRRRNRIVAAVSVIAILAIILGIASLVRIRKEQPAQPSSLAAPVPEQARAAVDLAEPEPGELATAPLRVTIDFTEDCWVEALVDEERTVSELRVQGESMRIDADERILLTLGNPPGARVEVNGRPFDVPQAPNRIVRNLEIDLALAEALEGRFGASASGEEAPDMGPSESDAAGEMVEAEPVLVGGES